MKCDAISMVQFSILTRDKIETILHSAIRLPVIQVICAFMRPY